MKQNFLIYGKSILIFLLLQGFFSIILMLCVNLPIRYGFFEIFSDIGIFISFYYTAKYIATQKNRCLFSTLVVCLIFYILLSFICTLKWGSINYSVFFFHLFLCAFAVILGNQWKFIHEFFGKI